MSTFSQDISAVLHTAYSAGITAYRYVPEILMTAGVSSAAFGKQYSWLNMNSMSTTKFATIVTLIYYVADQFIKNVLGKKNKKLKNSLGDLILIGSTIKAVHWKFFSDLPIEKALVMTFLANQVAQGVDALRTIFLHKKDPTKKTKTYLSSLQQGTTTAVVAIVQYVKNKEA